MCARRSAGRLRCLHTLHRFPLLGDHEAAVRAGCPLAKGRMVPKPVSGRRGCCPQPRGVAGTWVGPEVDREDETPMMMMMRKMRRFEPVPLPGCHSLQCSRCEAASAGRSVGSEGTWGARFPGLSLGSEGVTEGPWMSPPKGKMCWAVEAEMGWWGWKEGIV